MFPEPFRHTCKGLARRTSVHAAADACGYNGHLSIVSARRRRRDVEVSGGDYADNTRSATNREVKKVAVILAGMPDGEDEISSATGRVFVAKTPEIFTYDADGNMTGDGRFRYFWNEENRMVCASNAEVVVTYAYDHRGRMIRKNITRGVAEMQSVSYIWDNWNIIRETQTTGHSSQTTYNVWGLDLDGTMQGAGGVGGLLAVVREDGTYLPAYDANGNISEYVGSSSGAVAAHREYSPFGGPVISAGDCYSFSHWFSTKPWCGGTKLLEYQFRKYNPEIGRWMSRDPIGEKSNFRLYVIANNSPIFLFDILGLMISFDVTTYGPSDINTIERLRILSNNNHYNNSLPQGIFLVESIHLAAFRALVQKSGMYKILYENPTVRLKGSIAWKSGDIKAEVHEKRHMVSNRDNLELYDKEISRFNGKTFCGVANVKHIQQYLEIFREYIIQKARVDDCRIDFEDYPPELYLESNFIYMNSYNQLFELELEMTRAKEKIGNAY